MWNYKTDYHVFRMGVQLGDCDGDMADNLYSEKYFQRDCEERLGDRYVVQIFHNILRHTDVPVYFDFRKK